MKICNTCKKYLNEDSFNKSQRQCKECAREYYREYYKKNKERLLARNKYYNELTKEERKKKNKEKYKKFKLNNPELFLLNAAKRRAKKYGFECDLKVTDIHIPEKCPVLGIPIFQSDARQTHNSPSIDRIDSSKGYTSDNIIVVSWRANWLKNNATPEELIKLANFYSKL